MTDSTIATIWETLGKEDCVWCSTCETLVVRISGTSSCQVCGSVYEASFLMQEFHPNNVLVTNPSIATEPIDSFFDGGREHVKIRLRFLILCWG
jgi:hypothetical protein